MCVAVAGGSHRQPLWLDTPLLVGISHLNVPRDAAPDVQQLHATGLACVCDYMTL